MAAEPEPLLLFPEWLVLSGLPRHLNELANSPAAWPLFRAIVELDMQRHPRRPGIVEVMPEALAARAGVAADRVARLVPSLRRGRVVRAFLPDAEEEPALFQVLTPIATPIAAGEVLRAHEAFARVSIEDLRYATAPEAPAEPAEALRAAIDQYLDTISMRMNTFTFDDLRIIAERYEPELVRRVFERAARRERPSLGWIMAELRREDAIRRASASERPG